MRTRPDTRTTPDASIPPRGFSLVEIAMVLIILGIMATVLVPPLTTSIKREKVTAERGDIQNLRNTVVGFARKYGYLPDDDGSQSINLWTLAERRDAWNNNYRYIYDDAIADSAIDICDDSLSADITATVRSSSGTATVDNIAFIVTSDGSDGVRDIDVSGAPSYVLYATDGSIPNDDLVAYVSLDELRSMADCHGSSNATGENNGGGDDYDPNLVADLDMNEYEGDTIGSGEYTGTIYGDAEWVTGKVGTAIDFNNNGGNGWGGRNSYVEIEDDGAVNGLDLTCNGTIMAWIYVHNFRDFMGIIHKGDDDGYPMEDEAYSLQFWQREGSGGWHNPDYDKMPLLALQDGRTGSAENSEYFFSSRPEICLFADESDELNTWTWYHVAGVWDENNMRIYVDGEQSSSRTMPAGFVANGCVQITDGDVQIGSQLGEDGNAEYGFDGIIDEVYIYNRTMSAEEIYAYWNATK